MISSLNQGFKVMELARHEQKPQAKTKPKFLTLISFVTQQKANPDQTINFYLLRLSVCTTSIDLRTFFLGYTEIMRENNVAGKIPQKPIQSIQPLEVPSNEINFRTP